MKCYAPNSTILFSAKTVVHSMTVALYHGCRRICSQRTLMVSQTRHPFSGLSRPRTIPRFMETLLVRKFAISCTVRLHLLLYQEKTTLRRWRSDARRAPHNAQDNSTIDHSRPNFSREDHTTTSALVISIEEICLVWVVAFTLSCIFPSSESCFLEPYSN